MAIIAWVLKRCILAMMASGLVGRALGSASWMDHGLGRIQSAYVSTIINQTTVV